MSISAMLHTAAPNGAPAMSAICLATVTSTCRQSIGVASPIDRSRASASISAERVRGGDRNAPSRQRSREIPIAASDFEYSFREWFK